VFPKLGDLPFSSFSFYFSLSCYIWARGGQIPSDERNVGAGVTALFPCSEQCGVSTKLSLSTKPPPVRVPLNLAPCLMHRHGPCRRWLCPCGRHWRLRFRCRCPCSHFRLRLCHCHCLCARCCPTRVAAIASATIVVAAVSPGSILDAAAAFVVTHGFAFAADVAVSDFASAVGSSAALLSPRLCRSPAFVDVWSAPAPASARIC